MPLLLGTAPNQVPTNGDLGTLAFQDSDAIGGDVSVGGNLTVSGTGTNSLTGNVGIGTSAPVSILDVAGITPTITIKDTQSKTWVSGDKVGDLDFYSSDSSGTGPRTVARIRSFADNAGTTAAGALSFWTSAADSAATEKMRLDYTGNLGIGATPTTKFQVTKSALSGFLSRTAATATLENSADTELYFASGNANVGQLRFGDDGSNFRGAISYDHSIDGFRFYTAAIERIVLDSAGNLGIGTAANSSAILDAQSTTKGVRMPNMTTTQKNAIASPAAGLMVFDTTLSKLCVYTGAAWQTITSA